MIELIADLVHDVWSKWMIYLFTQSVQNPDGSVTIPADKAKRWNLQAWTDYAELSESEKESDREIAKCYLDRFSKGMRSDLKMKRENQ